MNEESLNMQYDATHRFDRGRATSSEEARGSQAEEQPLQSNMLLVYWELYSRTQQWTSAHTIAESIISAMPEEPIAEGASSDQTSRKITATERSQRIVIGLD